MLKTCFDKYGSCEIKVLFNFFLEEIKYLFRIMDTEQYPWVAIPKHFPCGYLGRYCTETVFHSHLSDIFEVACSTFWRNVTFAFIIKDRCLFITERWCILVFGLKFILESMNSVSVINNYISFVKKYAFTTNRCVCVIHEYFSVLAYN